MRSPAPTLLALWCLTFASTSQVLLVSPLLPRIGEELAVPEALGGALIAAYGGAAAVAALVAGPISDRYGRRPVLLVGTAWMALTLWAHLLAGSFAVLLGLRALAGIAGGILGGAAVAYVGDAFPYERRGWANGWVMSGFALGQVLGIPLGTWFGDRYGFRAPFLGFAVLMTLAFVLTAVAVPQPPVPLAKELGLTAAIWKYRALATSARTRGALLMYLTMFVGVALQVAYLPTWLEGRFQVDGDQVATMFLIGGVAAVLTNPLAGRLSDRIGRKRPILAACALFAVTAAATPYVVSSFWLAYPMFFVTMVAASMRIPPTQSLVSALVPADERGSLLSFGSALGQAGFAAGGGLAGILFHTGGYPACAWAAAASVALTGAIVWVAVPEPQGSTSTQP